MLLKEPLTKVRVLAVWVLPVLLVLYFKPVMLVLARFGRLASFVWLAKHEEPYHQTIEGSLTVCSFGPLARPLRMFASIANMLSPRAETFVFSKSTVSRFVQLTNALCIGALLTVPSARAL